jgi:ABC-type uncharacterized transport system substrate-binding protein
MRFMSRILAVLLLFAFAGPVAAHPHVQVKVRSDILFDQQGKITGIRHAWTFDEVYSVFAVQGLSRKGKLFTVEELAPVAAQNMTDLVDFKFFTFAKAAGSQLSFAEPVNYSASENPDSTITLHFTLPLSAPASAAKGFTLQVYDPTYFADFQFNPESAVTLDSPPSGCSTSFIKPAALAEADAKKLNESFFSGLSPGSDFGVKLAGRVIVACP